MKLRMSLMLVAMMTLVGVLGAVKVYQVKAAVAQFASFQPPPEAVTTIVAAQDRWPATLDAIGTVTAVRGVTVSADLPGVVERIAFESGQAVGQGDVLVVLDTRLERAQLAAAEARLALARANLERTRGLVADGIVTRADNDKAEAEFKESEASAGEIRATIARKTIVAPFPGVLGIRQVNLGQYLAGGAPIVSLQAMSPVYVDFAVPQQQAARLAVGTGVRVRLEDGAAEALGRVTALDSVVDEATRNVMVQATLANPEHRFKPGMFVQASLQLDAGRTIVTLPTSSVNYAPYGDSVFVVGQMKGPDGRPYRGVQQRFVKLGGSRGDQVAVLSGLVPGEEVVTSGVFKLRNGAAVQVNNTVQPSNKPVPRPEDS